MLLINTSEEAGTESGQAHELLVTYLINLNDIPNFLDQSLHLIWILLPTPAQCGPVKGGASSPQNEQPPERAASRSSSSPGEQPQTKLRLSLSQSIPDKI